MTLSWWTFSPSSKEVDTSQTNSCPHDHHIYCPSCIWTLGISFHLVTLAGSMLLSIAALHFLQIPSLVYTITRCAITFLSPNRQDVSPYRIIAVNSNSAKIPHAIAWIPMNNNFEKPFLDPTSNSSYSSIPCSHLQQKYLKELSTLMCLTPISPRPFNQPYYQQMAILKAFTLSSR